MLSGAFNYLVFEFALTLPKILIKHIFNFCNLHSNPIIKFVKIISNFMFNLRAIVKARINAKIIVKILFLYDYYPTLFFVD